MKFAVIRHPDAGMGTCPESSLEQHRANGWMRVSEWRDEPSDFHLPDFAEALEDLDPPLEPEADPETAPETAADSSADSEEKAPARSKNKIKEQDA